jgi:Domain of unknown function (DUF4365)
VLRWRPHKDGRDADVETSGEQMTTKRKRSKAVARAGINYVRATVEQCNCIFHEIDLDNDIGNDAYIEFIEKEEATGCIIAAQIKSGQSYFRDDRRYAAIQCDRDHFEYWVSHSLPIVMIAYNPDDGSAAWCDVTESLMREPEKIEKGPYVVHVPLSCRFAPGNFATFYHHFLKYRQIYKQDGYLGRALRDFASLDNREACFDGIFSLFSFHRDRIESWYYIISCFRNFRDHPALIELIIAVCHLTGHGDIYWHRNNIIDEETRKEARALLSSHFSRDELTMMLGEIDEENGICHGSIGQCVQSIVDALGGSDELLGSVAFDGSVAENTRYWALMLLAYYMQDRGHESCTLLERYLKMFPHSAYGSAIEELRNVIREHGGFALY